jgi:glyoxylase-like metal-dependent hydrolase (beta-lactamase superfamily II)
MQLGEFQLTTVSGGRFRTDGGSMFGVVPKVLWSKVFPADERNLIAQATNCVLVQTPKQNILIDTGYGSKLSEKERNIHATESDNPLGSSLDAIGLSVDQVDLVILSHLHFDHAGGATRSGPEGQFVPEFPNATYVVQREEWEIATAEVPELRIAYPQDNLLPLQEAGQLRLIDGDVEIIPGVRSIVTGGHTAGHAAILLESRGEAAVYLADICPTTRHLHSLWCMAYDVDLLQTRRFKPKILGEIADNGWLALFDHDPDHAAARICRDEKREFAVSESIDRL